MFSDCESLTQLDLSGFNTDNVTQMWNMFGNCGSLTQLDLSGFNTGNVTQMWSMFYDCESLTELDVSNFDTSNVTDMKWMFHGCESLTELDVSNFDTSNVTDMKWMFEGCESLTKLDVSGFDTCNVTNMKWMFEGCESLTELDVSGFNTSNVTDMNHMFSYCISLTQLDVSDFDTGNVTDMSYMFGGSSFLGSALENLDVSGFDTRKVTNMEGMFFNCRSLIQLDLSNFDMSSVQYADNMLMNMDSLKSLKTPKNLGISVPFLLYEFKNDVMYDEYVSMYDSSGNEYTELPKNMSTSIALYPDPDAIPENVDLSLDEGVIVPFGEVWIRILNENGQALAGATVEYSDSSKITNEKGIVKFSNYKKGLSLTIKADGYADRKVDSYVRKNRGYDTYVMDIGLQSVIFTLNGRDIDLLSKSKSIDLKNKDTLFDLTVQTANAEMKKYALYSGDRLIAESDNGKFADLCYKSFQEGETVSISCYSASGRLLDSRKLNLTVKQGEIYPTSVSVGNGLKITLGKDVPLLGGTQLEISLEDLPWTFKVTDGKVKALLGFELKKLSSEEEDWYEWYEKVKSLNKDSYSQFLKEMQSGKDEKDNKGKIKFKNKINGYLEGPFGLTEIGTSLSGKLYYEGTVSYKKEDPMMIATVPVVVELAIKGKVTAGGEIEWTIQDGMAGNITIGTSFEVGLYAGVGLAKLASAGAYGSVEMGMEWQWFPIEEQKFNEVYLEGKAGLQVKLLGRSVGKLVLWKGKYYIVKRDTSHSTLSASSQLSIDYDTVYPNVVTGEAISVYNLTECCQDGNLMEQVVQDSVSADIDPQIVTTENGVKLLAYLDNDSERSEGNRSTLVYSIYDENKQSWSAPIAVYDNGTADFNPDFYADGDDIYAVWQDADSALESNLTLNQIADRLDLTIAKYDPQAGTFDVIDTMEGELLKQQPQIVAKDGNIRVYWHENEEDNVLGLSGTNHFYYAEWMETSENTYLLNSRNAGTAEEEEITEIEESEEESAGEEETSTVEEESSSEEASSTEEVSSTEETSSSEEASSTEETSSTEEASSAAEEERSSADIVAERSAEISTEVSVESSEETSEETTTEESEDAGSEGVPESGEPSGEDVGSGSEEVDTEETETDLESEKAESERNLSETRSQNIYSLGESTDAVLSQDAGVMQGKICFAATTGALDEEYNIASGRVILWDDEQSRTISEGSGTNVDFCTLYNERTLTWFDEGEICYLDASGQVKTLLGDTILSGVDYVLLQDGDGNPVLIYVQSGNDSSNLYQINCLSGQESLTPVCISTQDQYIQNVDGFYNGDGWELVYNKMTVEDLEECSNVLCTGSVDEDIFDLELQLVSVYDHWDEESEQRITESSLTIYNAGNKDIGSFTLSMEDSAGTQLDVRQMDVSIPVGESVVVKAEYPKNKFTKKDTYTWKICGISDERRTDNNSYALEIGASCLEVETELIQAGSLEVAEITILNSGLEETGGTLKITDYEKGTEYLSQEFDAIGAGETKIFTCNIAAENFENRECLNLTVEVIPNIKQDNSDLLTESFTVNAPKYTVCFMQEDAEPYYVFDINYGNKVSFPNNPQKQGSYFAGWHTEEGILYTEETAITQDVTLYPLWKEEDTIISMEQCSVSAIADQYYTGKALEPNVNVKYGNLPLKNGKDYTVSYRNNSKQGTAEVIITGKGSYTGSTSRNFKIYYNINNASAAKLQTVNYTGKAITPDVKLTYGGTTLKKGTDYTLSYRGNKDAGTACVVVTGKGKYRGSRECFFTINGIDIGKMTFEKVPDVTYNAEEQQAEVTVKDKAGQALKQGIDYQLVYEDTEKAGTAYVTVIGRGNYSGSKKLSYRILPVSMSDVEAEYTQEFEYSGESFQPVPTLTYKGTVLTENVDYKVKYYKNSNVGTAEIVIKGKGNYKGSLKKTFVIHPHDMEKDDTISVVVSDMAYTGRKVRPSVSVFCQGKELNKKEYQISYNNNVEMGTGSVTITGRNNYTGSITQSFRIVEKGSLISKCSVDDPASVIYDGTAHAPEVTVMNGKTVLVKDVDYTLSYENNINAGTASVIIRGIGKYAGEKKAEFAILRQDIGKNASVAQMEELWYTGYEQKPSANVTINGMTLTEGIDYKLTYKNNTKPGTAQVSVIGMGNYTGKLTETFVIKDWDFKDLSVSFADRTYNQKKQKPVPEFTLDGESIKLRQGTVYTVSYTDNVSVGYAKVTITGKGLFKNADPIVSSFHIDPLDIDDAVISKIADQTFKGALATPVPSVKVGRLRLVKERDFTVSYVGNGTKGEATVIISGKGNCVGTCEAKFVIR